MTIKLGDNVEKVGKRKKKAKITAYIIGQERRINTIQGVNLINSQQFKPNY